MKRRYGNCFKDMIKSRDKKWDDGSIVAVEINHRTIKLLTSNFVE